MKPTRPVKTRSRTEPAAPPRQPRSGGFVDAPGKKHRKPPESLHGVKHSDQQIAKLRGAAQMRRLPSGR